MDEEDRQRAIIERDNCLRGNFWREPKTLKA